MYSKRSAVNTSEYKNVAKKSCIFIALEKKVEVICRMGDDQTCPDECRNVELPPSTVSTIMKNADKVKQSMQHATTVCAMQVSYSRSKLLQKKLEKLLSL